MGKHFFFVVKSEVIYSILTFKQHFKTYAFHCTTWYQIKWHPQTNAANTATYFDVLLLKCNEVWPKYPDTFVTQDHKISHKGKFFEIEI